MAEALPFKTTMQFAYGEPRELAPGVVRIVANNPSPFTFKGTNTYIIDKGGDLALIDPGPARSGAPRGDPEDDRQAAADAYSHHPHPPRSHRRPAGAAGGHRCQDGGLRPPRANGGSKRISTSGSEFVDRDFVPDVPLADGQTLKGDGWAFEALHTPGHAPDHLCFALAGTGVLFSGDHVMGWNTSVVAPPEGKMGDYIRSLEKLTGRNDSVYFPGHGGQFEDPQRLVKAFLLHRRMRENAILECIRGGNATVRGIVPVLYRDLDPRLVNAASLSVLAHVEHLIERGLVRSETPLSREACLSPV